MRSLVSGSRKGFFGLVLAMLLATGARSYAGQGYYCWATCGDCAVWVTGCDWCASATNGESCIAMGNCTDAGCECTGGGSCWVY